MFQKLVDWSEQHYSELPWRKNRSLYTTLVSEIMLQQTTVSTVINHFDRFIEKYPSVEDLAKISEEQILIDWKGLGYYRRAKNLLKAAKNIVEKFEGQIPQDFELLKSIHGIGDYTANALISIGANRPAISLDANLERVLSRFYGVRVEKGPKLQKELYKQFSEDKICHEINSLGARKYNEALMDLGRSICKARSTACEICPLAKSCVALSLNEQTVLPIDTKSKKVEKYYDLDLLRVIVKKDDKILVYKKDKNEWLAGQYEVPTFIMNSEDENLKQYKKLDENNDLYFLPSFKTSITKYKISNHILWANSEDFKKISSDKFEWKELEGLNLSTGSIKALDAL